jgi:hypothetical protein
MDPEGRALARYDVGSVNFLPIQARNKSVQKSKQNKSDTVGVISVYIEYM